MEHSPSKHEKAYQRMEVVHHLHRPTVTHALTCTRPYLYTTCATAFRKTNHLHKHWARSCRTARPQQPNIAHTCFRSHAILRPDTLPTLPSCITPTVFVKSGMSYSSLRAYAQPTARHRQQCASVHAMATPSMAYHQDLLHHPTLPCGCTHIHAPSLASSVPAWLSSICCQPHLQPQATTVTHHQVTNPDAADDTPV